MPEQEHVLPLHVDCGHCARLRRIPPQIDLSVSGAVGHVDHVAVQPAGGVVEHEPVAGGVRLAVGGAGPLRLY